MAIEISGRFATTRGKTKGGGLDYTLLTLQGSPESYYGEVIPTSEDANVGNWMNFIQHPAGRPKEIGYYADAGNYLDCTIE